eukprot:7776286-Pyramimonas_sp.AAC.1
MLEGLEPLSYDLPEALDWLPCPKRISEQDWIATKNYHKGKHEDGFVDGEFYPALCDPYEAAQDMILRHKWMEDQRILHGAWVPAGGKDIEKAPGPKMHKEIIQTLHNIILADWEDVKFNIYENQDGHWVIRFYLDSGTLPEETYSNKGTYSVKQ